MAINIDSYIDVQYGGDTVTRIGLSAGMDTIANEDILNYVFCASYNKIIHGVVPRKTDVSMNTYRQEIPFNFTLSDPNVEINIGGYDTNPNGIFMGVIWLYTDIFANHPENNGNLSHFKIVMDWDAPNYFITCPDPNGKRDNITSWSSGNGTKCYATTGTIDSLTYDYNGNNITVSDIYPYMIFKMVEGEDNLLFISALRQNANTFRARPFTKGTQTRFIGTTTLKSFRNNEQTYSPVGAKMATYGKALPYNWYMGSSPGQSSANPNAYGDTEMQNLFFYTEGGSNSASTIGCMDWTWFLNTRRESLLFWASNGLKFKAGNYLYKPIIRNGIVVDYSDDMDAESDLDDWSGTTNHNVPITPPSPSGGGEDDIDSMGFDGMSCSVGGPARYYVMSYSNIHHLIGDFNAHAEPGTSISNNIISCYVNALDWNWSTGSEPIEIYSGGAQTVAFKSDTNYAVLTGYNARDIIGSIDVPRMTNTFYDFSPYSTYEVYVPFCGWVALPDTVAGRHLKIYFETDEATCGCKGRVFFVDDDGNGVTVAEITGSFGAPCPIQVIEGGLYKQAMLSNGLQVIGGIASGIMGGASGAGVLAVSGLSNAMQGLGNCLVAGNTNYGQTIGRAGDASGLMCAGKPYLKITYPPVDEVVNNYMFAHTVGYLCNTIEQLSNFHGFTVCANPHIHISATSTEKEEIKRLLEEGVILP